MKTLHDQLRTILPQRIRPLLPEEEIGDLTEIRMRIGRPMQLTYLRRQSSVGEPITTEDLSFVVNTACRYSPWNARSIHQGYLTAPGGHRIGLCGETAGDGMRTVTSLCIRVAKDLHGISGRIPVQDSILILGAPGSGKTTLLPAGDGMRTVTSLCIRVAKDLHGISGRIPVQDSILILGAPGSGKTTLLRDYIRRISGSPMGSVCVVDERGEIFPFSGGKMCFDPGNGTDVMTGRSKAEGIDCVIRAMGPKWIAVDEITRPADCDALVQALWCGVKVVATAHAASVRDLFSRPVYRPIVDSGVFSTAVVLHTDKSYHLERITT